MFSGTSTAYVSRHRSFLGRLLLGISAEERGSVINIDSSSPLIGPEAQSSTATSAIIRTGHLPSPTLGMIGEIDRAIKALSRTQQVKEKICEYIQAEVRVVPVSFLCRMYYASFGKYIGVVRLAAGSRLILNASLISLGIHQAASRSNALSRGSGESAKSTRSL